MVECIGMILLERSMTCFQGPCRDVRKSVLEVVVGIMGDGQRLVVDSNRKEGQVSNTEVLLSHHLAVISPKRTIEKSTGISPHKWAPIVRPPSSRQRNTRMEVCILH